MLFLHLWVSKRASNWFKEASACLWRYPENMSLVSDVELVSSLLRRFLLSIDGIPQWMCWGLMVTYFSQYCFTLQTSVMLYNVWRWQGDQIFHFLLNKTFGNLTTSRRLLLIGCFPALKLIIINWAWLYDDADHNILSFNWNSMEPRLHYWCLSQTMLTVKKFLWYFCSSTCSLIVFWWLSCCALHSAEKFVFCPHCRCKCQKWKQSVIVNVHDDLCSAVT